MTTSIKDELPTMTWEKFEYATDELAIAVLEVEARTLITLINGLYKEGKITKDYLKLMLISFRNIQRSIKVMLELVDKKLDNADKRYLEINKDTAQTGLETFYELLEAF